LLGNLFILFLDIIQLWIFTLNFIVIRHFLKIKIKIKLKLK
jgi:hypothetical protein